MGTNRASIQEREAPGHRGLHFVDVPMADVARLSHRLLVFLRSTQMTISSSAHECPCVSWFFSCRAVTPPLGLWTLRLLHLRTVGSEGCWHPARAVFETTGTQPLRCHGRAYLDVQ